MRRGLIKFQSTLPARGATIAGTDGEYDITISIHAPRTGSDDFGVLCLRLFARFQSTLPARGATPLAVFSGIDIIISIHAPRTGSDSANNTGWKLRNYFNPRSPHGERRPFCCWQARRHPHFNPRSPHGERQVRIGSLLPGLKFQSTLPARGATQL